MLETGETKKNRTIGVNLIPTKTTKGQVKLKNASASSITSLGESQLLKDLLKPIPNFAAQQQRLSGKEPVIKNNPVLGEYQLNDDLGGLQHGTYLQATNSESQTKSRSLVSRNEMKTTASLVNYQTATELSGYGQLKNITETTKSVEVVYTLPTFESTGGTAQVVIDKSRINEFDGLEYKDEKGNVIPGFDITYSYRGHEGEYSTIDTLKQREDFSWDKVTAVMVFGSLLPNSSYRIEFPFKIINLENINSQEIFSLNEYAFYDLTINKHTTSQLKFRLSTPIFSRDDYKNVRLMALGHTEEGYHLFPQEVQEIMPTLGEIPYAISNFNNRITINNDPEKVMWQGGQYIFTLDAIQSAVQEKGFSVSVDETGRSLMKAYAFTVSNSRLDFENLDFIPYAVIHHLLITKDFTLKAEAKDKWNSYEGVVKVSGLSAENEEVPVSPEQTFIIEDSDLDDATPGKYKITIGYFLNGSENDDMLVTSTTNVTIVENKQTINVHYVDLGIAEKNKEEVQPSDGKILEDQTQTFTGKDEETYHNQLWGEQEGFEIFKYDKEAEEGTFAGGQPPKDYYVYLTHKIKKVDETHQVTRTITFNMPDGAKQVIEQKGKIQRSSITDKTTNKEQWSDWSEATLPAVIAPTVPGYTSKNVDEQPITLTTKDSSLNVIYQPKKINVKLLYVDENSNIIDEQLIAGLAGETIDHIPTVETDKLADEGYVIVDNELPDGARFVAENGNHVKEYRITISKQGIQTQPIKIYYIDVPYDRLPIVKPTSGKIISDQTQEIQVAEGETYTNKLWEFENAGYKLFKADKGALRGKYFGGSSEQQYYVYLTHQQAPLKDVHPVTRTIKVIMPDQTEQIVTQEANAIRLGTHDKVTGENSWHPWKKGLLPEYIPTPISGYKVANIPAVDVDEDTTDYEMNIAYTAESAEISVKFVDQFGEELKVESFTGNPNESFNYDPTEQIKMFEDQGYIFEETDLPADPHFASGKHTYKIKFKKLVAVTPHDDTENIVSEEKEAPVNNENVKNKKRIFTAFKKLF